MSDDLLADLLEEAFTRIYAPSRDFVTMAEWLRAHRDEVLWALGAVPTTDWRLVVCNGRSGWTLVPGVAWRFPKGSDDE